jgi:histidinol-phosphate aminotransferase
VTIVLDEAYIEFQANDDPDLTLDMLGEFPNLVLMRTFSKVYGLAGLRVGYAIGSAKFRAAIDAVRQPFSVNALAQAAGAEAVLHSDDVERRVETNVVERVRVESGLDELEIAHAESQTNFSWIDLGDAAEDEVVAYLGAERSIAVRPGSLLGGPGHLRISYGTPAENERLLAALGDVLG